MAEIIAICNQKGGVGKTTTAVNLSACLAAAEKKTLIIDIDPQGNASSGLGVDKRTITKSIYQPLIGESPIRDSIQKTDIAFLDIIPANPDLAGAEIELVDVASRETRLKNALAEIRGDYEYIIIDSPPSLGLLTLNAMTAADSVLIPVQCEYYALEGIADLQRTIQLVKASLNRELQVKGIVLTMFDGRNSLSKMVSDEIRNFFKEAVFEVVIPRNVKLAEAPSFGKPIILYDVRSRGTESYFNLAIEILNRKMLDERSTSIVTSGQMA